MTLKELLGELNIAFDFADHHRFGHLPSSNVRRLEQACEHIAEATHRSTLSVWAEIVGGRKVSVGGMTRPDLDTVRWEAGL